MISFMNYRTKVFVNSFFFFFVDSSSVFTSHVFAIRCVFQH